MQVELPLRVAPPRQLEGAERLQPAARQHAVRRAHEQVELHVPPHLRHHGAHQVGVVIAAVVVGRRARVAQEEQQRAQVVAVVVLVGGVVVVVEQLQQQVDRLVRRVAHLVLGGAYGLDGGLEYVVLGQVAEVVRRHLPASVPLVLE